MKVLLRTFGCRANHYDAEQVRAMAQRAGADVVDASGDHDADAAREDGEVAVLTSCAVTSAAEADLRQTVRRLARERPALRIIVTGCAAARSTGTIAALPNVTAVIPGADLAATAAAMGLDAARSHERPIELRRAAQQSTARATLRVQDGCDEHCTFCATTLARGAHRSRGMDELVEEARLLEQHHAEIVLTGIHVGSWGKESGVTLGSLVRRLVEGTRTARFRLASVEATEVDDELAELLRSGSPRVCPYLHAPLQSGSDAVLKRMGRHWYTGVSYARAIERLVRDRAVFGLGADVMAGFPGETEADHRATLEMVRALPFTHLHVFPYSARPGTAAPRLGAPIPASVVQSRAAELREAATVKQVAYAAARIGGGADAVVISPPSPGTNLRSALTEDYLELRLETPAPRGARLNVRIGEEMLPARPATASHQPSRI